ncbi:hypothetical protein [Absidia glauca]|uniref:MSP domain-containing protein n=1 Tax=Absidia glauca TaxID=4829 RepID=A0A168PPC4_ABSGL|nr:hypothetical protein [Absidia glauca]
MTVVLDPPSQLVFRRPLTQPIEEFLQVRNVGTEPMAFKVKTTAPKQYCVRPNSGIIQPSSHVEVQVIFQPFKEEPAPDFKCKDKFLVQTAVVKPDWVDWNMVELWSHIETTDYRDTLSQRKVKCVFLPPEAPQPATTTPDETSAVMDDPPTPTSSHDRNRTGSLSTNGILEEGTDEDDNGHATPSPTLSSALPALIDAANKSSSLSSSPPAPPQPKPYDSISSSVSLFTAHTATPAIKSPPPPRETKDDVKQIQQLTHEKEQLQQELSKAQAHKKQLEEQVHKEQTDLKSAHTLVDQLQQQIKTLAQHQAPVLPVDGYPPHVLLSVSALVFIFTYLFF